jgi:hypothetical protein
VFSKVCYISADELNNFLPWTRCEDKIFCKAMLISFFATSIQILMLFYSKMSSLAHTKS